MPRIVLFALIALTCGACSKPIDMRKVESIELAGRFVQTSPGMTPTKDSQPMVLDGGRLRQILTTASCREGKVVWKGGIPATLVMLDGTRVEVPGFSQYGAFLKISADQWCKFSDQDWAAIWPKPEP